MAGTFTATGSYSNLTRKELEQLRRADFFAGGKALTVGDSGLPPEGVVGVGSVNAEPYTTLPSLRIADAYAVSPPDHPANYLTRLVQIGATPSDSVQWYGPTHVTVSGGGVGFATTTTHWTDPTANFASVAANDMLVIKPLPDVTLNNSYVVATITAIAGTTLTLSNIRKVTGTPAVLDLDFQEYEYLVLRPNAIQLFAVPGSGPLGREQTFLAVSPTSTLHSNTSPTFTQIEADRIQSVVPPSYATTDRADAIYGGPNTGGPQQSVPNVGYRIILYKSNLAGTGPDLLSPIATLNPVIDSTILAADQRMTFDYKAGIVRFSCAPRAGDDIKLASGGVNPTTGRLSLFAVFWAVDQTLSAGASELLYQPRSDVFGNREPAVIYYDAARDAWLIQMEATSPFYVKSRQGNPNYNVEFGAIDLAYTGESSKEARYLRYTNIAGKGSWVFTSDGPPPFFPDPLSSMELGLANKTSYTMGDGSAPAQSPGADANPQQNFLNGVQTGARDPLPEVQALLTRAFAGGYGVVHLHKGRHYYTGKLQIPPGVILEGEGPATRLVSRGSGTTATPLQSSLIAFGSNTPWGVYDPTAAPVLTGTVVAPSMLNTPVAQPVRGYDLVWNANRRVWGVVMATGDGTGDGIWFNEFDTNGQPVVPNAYTQPNASVTSVVFPNATIIGLSGVTAAFVGFSVTVTGAASPGNNGTFAIVSVPSADTIIVHNPSAVPADANDGLIHVAFNVPGVDIKNDSHALFRSGSPNGKDHTPNHYPRIAYHEGQDEYAVVWVNENGGTGPVVQYQGVKTNALTGTNGFSLGDNRFVDNTGNFAAAGILPGYVVTINDGSASGAPYYVMDVGVNALILSRTIPAGGSIGYTVTGPTRKNPGGTIAVLGAPPYNVCSDHPSIAVSNLVTGSPYNVAISFWAYNTTSFNSNSTFCGNVYNAFSGSLTLISSTNNGAMPHAVVSSSDVCEDEAGGGFLFAYTVRSHSLIQGTAGNISGGFLFTDTAYPGPTPWADRGVEVGSRFLHNGGTDPVGNHGTDGRVTAIAGAGFTPIQDPTGPSVYQPSGGGSFKWAIAPRSSIWTRRYYFGAMSSAVQVTDNAPGATYAIECREPDFVRLSRGGGNWLLVYQSFNTTSFLSSDLIKNFDNGFDATFIDFAGIAAKSPSPFREHISTCALVLADNGTALLNMPRRVAASAPHSGSTATISATFGIEETLTGLTGMTIDNVGRTIDISGAANAKNNGTFRIISFISSSSVKIDNQIGVYPDANSGSISWFAESIDSAHHARDIEISSRSLGARQPLTVRPNQMTKAYHRSRDREVSALNFFHKWDTSLASPVSPSLLPDVTWTGSDWVVVSPSKGDIHSELGTYKVSGGNFYLSDPSFYFGDGTTLGPDGNILRATLTNIAGTFQESIFVPAAGPSGTYVNILSVYDEHTVQIDTDLSTLVPAVSNGTTNVEWMLAGATVGGAGKVKNPGFRVSAEGKLVLSTSYLTFADDTPTTTGAPGTADTLLMYRKGTTAINDGSAQEDFDTDTDARISGNIFYEGVAVGQPKGTSELYQVLAESPQVAISWGENFYGFLDRVYEGAATPTSYVGFWRQSFGPYRSGMRSLQAVGTDLSVFPMTLRSFNHVFTRHGSPVTYTGGFATDGYRNCFVYPAAYSWRTFFSEQTVIDAVYTDQVGRTKVRVRGPEQVNLHDRIPGQGGTTIASNITFTTPYKLRVTGLSGMTPQSVGRYLEISGAPTSSNNGRFPIVELTSSTNVVVSNPNGASEVGVALVDWEEYGDQQNISTRFISDLPANTPGNSLDKPAKSPTTPSSPVVIWDGSRFVACWTAINDTLTKPYTGFVCLGVLPGDEDGFFQGREVTGDTAVSHKILELARISCGDQVGPVLTISQLYACDLAYSGKVYAVLWIAGTNPTQLIQGGDAYPEGAPNSGLTASITAASGGLVTLTGLTGMTLADEGKVITLVNTANPNNGGTFTISTYLSATSVKVVNLNGVAPDGNNGSIFWNESFPAKVGGCAIGVAIFNGSGEVSGVANYLIDMTDELLTDTLKHAYTNPKILWDGKQFIAMWRRHAPDTVRQIEYAIIPETGLGYAPQIRRVGAVGHPVDKSPTAQGIGVISPSQDYITVSADRPVPCMPGDIVIISKTNTGGFLGTDSLLDAGTYVVKDYDPLTRHLYFMGEVQLQNAGATAYGMVLSGGIGDARNLPEASFPVTGATNGITAKPKALGYGSWSNTSQYGDTILRLNGTVYNDVTDEYAVLYTGYDSVSTNSALVLSSWKKGTFQLRQETAILPMTGIDNGVAALGWNGHHYLVVHYSESFGNLIAYQVSVHGKAENTTFLSAASGTNSVIGNGDGQTPGPGFDAPIAGSHIQPVARKITVQWNNRMNRWVVSAGYLWCDQVSSYLDATFTNLQAPTAVRKNAAPLSAATWVGRTLTLNAADGGGVTNIQPGLRLASIFATGPETTPTVVRFDGDRTVILDTDVSEVPAAAVTDFTTNAQYLGILPKEDVFCWTIGSNTPVVQLVDADDILIDGVEISSGQTDIEERFIHMSRPIWQSGGPPMGSPASFLGQRPSQYNHRFLTPTNKIDGLRLTNVKSLTRVKYGYGFSPGNPTFDRSTFGDRNRRG